MNLALHCFSKVVHHKSHNLKRALEKQGIKVLPWEKLSSTDGGIIYNIHNSVEPCIRKATQLGKKIISLQEGMYALGWPQTLPRMRIECQRANSLKIKQFVWSNFDRNNYIATGKDPQLIEAIGNPEYDDLLKEPKFNRATYDIPDDAFVICHLSQYTHPRGGPDGQQLELMRHHIRQLTKLDKKIWVIYCQHPIEKTPLKFYQERVVIRPFEYPVFDIIRFSNLVITVSSTEGLTAAILDKPIIEYDISDSPERWPFVKHGVAARATSENQLIRHIKTLLLDKPLFQKHMDYYKEYMVDGHTADRIATRIIEEFNAK